MRFELKDGGHTEVLFYRDGDGVTHPFPETNAELVKAEGTEKSKEDLERILASGVEAMRDRTYVAFVGPPIPPYKLRCYCGHVIAVGHDEGGYYIEGAQEIIFEPRGGGTSSMRGDIRAIVTGSRKAFIVVCALYPFLRLLSFYLGAWPMRLLGLIKARLEPARG